MKTGNTKRLVLRAGIGYFDSVWSLTLEFIDGIMSQRISSVTDLDPLSRFYYELWTHGWISDTSGEASSQ